MDIAAKKILDTCCGSRMFWFDKRNPLTIFGNIRDESHVLCDGRLLEIKPDIDLDFRSMPFEDGSFKLVVFDPPHLLRAVYKSWVRAKYGVLNQETWQSDLRQGFSECFRVLAPDGILIFKWNDTQIKVSQILALTDKRPLFGHPSGKKGGTHWMCFMST